MVEQQIPDEVAKVDIVMPSVEAAEPVAAKRLFCTLCNNRPFPTPGVAAMHFAKVHSELKTDREAWRKFVVANPQ